MELMFSSVTPANLNYRHAHTLNADTTLKNKHQDETLGVSVQLKALPTTKLHQASPNGVGQAFRHFVSRNVLLVDVFSHRSSRSLDTLLAGDDNLADQVGGLLAHLLTDAHRKQVVILATTRRV